MKKLLCVLSLVGILPTFAKTVTITDTEPEPKNVELEGGDTLEIRGNGLTADCTVTITDSGYKTTAMIKFLSTATIAAPISVTGSVEFDVAANVTGTVAGKLTVTNNHPNGDEHVRSVVESGGLLRYTGGGILAGTGCSMYTTFRVMKGAVEITGKPFESSFSLSMLGGHLTVKDGGAWTANGPSATGLYLGRSDQSLDATFEIGKDGSATFGANHNIYIAYKKGCTSKLYVNGGTLTTASSNGHFYFNYDQNGQSGGRGTGIFEIANGGVYSTDRKIEVGTTGDGVAEVVLGDGTWQFYGTYWYDYLFCQTVASGGLFKVLVNGDFTLDFSKYGAGNVLRDRQPAGTYPALDLSWAVAEDAKLTFGGRSDLVETFTINNLQPEGRFDIGFLEGKPLSLNLANASEDLHFGVTLPLPSGWMIKATGTSPAATVDLAYASTATAPTVLTEALLSSSLVDFSSLTLGDRFAFNGTETGTVFVSPAISSGFSSVKIGSGTLILKNVSALPAGTVVETSGDGALALVNATGFDPETRMAGTKNLTDIASGLVITDTTRTGAVAVGNGQTLLVYGDGLGEEASVSLAAGATLKFMADSAIAASVSTGAGTVTLSTIEGVTGTIAGKLTQTGEGSALLQLQPLGVLNFIGGGEIGDGGVAAAAAPLTSFALWSAGTVQITNKPFEVRCSLNVFKGSMRIADGGSWTTRHQWAHLNLNKGAEQYSDVCLEIGTGGFVSIGGNCHLFLGSNAATTYESRLFLNGGTFYRNGADHFYVRGKAVVEIDNGGTLATSRLIEVGSTSGLARVILKNGTWNGNNEWAGNNDYTSLFAQESGVGASTCAVSLAGDFTVDISHYTSQNIANDAGDVSNWSVEPGARLHVVGHGANTKKLKFVNFAGEGLALDLNATSNTDVVFDNVPETVTVGFVLPGKTSSRIQATTTEPDLHVGYVVPNGQTYELGTTAVNLTTTGFNSVTRTDDLTLDAGSTVVIPWNGAGSPYVLDGSLRLPDETATVNYKLKRNAPVGKQDGTVILNANEIVGNPSWVCVGGAQADRATLAVEGDSLVFGYDPPGVVLIVR